MFVHGFFHPVIVEFFKSFCQSERGFAVVIVIGVEHEGHVEADSFAHGSTSFEVSFNTGCALVRWLPGVEFEGGVPAFHAPFGKAGIVLGRGQTAFEVVAAHGRGIGGHFVAVPAEQFVNGLVEGAPGQIPEGEVNGHDDSIGYRV